MIPKTLEFIPPKRLPEANIQAELYRKLRDTNIKCCLEYRMFCKETNSFIRVDAITLLDGRITSFIECKSRNDNFQVAIEGSQYQKYKTFGIPIFYCMNFKHVTRTVELVELLHTQGIYKDNYLQTFKDQEKRRTMTRADRKKEREDNYRTNWDLLLASKLSYTCFTQTHIRICNKIDLWPGSGKWMVLGEMKSRTGGFRELAKFLPRVIHN